MRHLFRINAEGGPLVCADARLARQWRGIENGGRDYERVCAMLTQSAEPPGVVFEISGGTAAAWEMGGGGTADIFAMEPGDTIRIIRAWTDIDSTDIFTELAGADGGNQTIIGTIKVPTRYLAILWATESGELIPERIEGDIQRVRGTSTEKSAYVMRVKNEMYRCSHDEVEIGDSRAIRLTLSSIQES